MASLSALSLRLLAPALVLAGALGAPVVQTLVQTEEPESSIEDLRAASEENFLPALESLYAQFRERALALEFEEAIRLGQSMHDEVMRRGEKWMLTSGWSATQLGLAYTRAGDHEAAEAVLSERIELFELRLADLRSREGTDPTLLSSWIRGLNGLLDRRAMARLAAGDEAGGIADLGAGLARGSSNARLILARRALRRASQRSGTSKFSTVASETLPNIEARRLFSTLLEEEPNVAAWALRGWGLTLLPPSRTQ